MGSVCTETDEGLALTRLQRAETNAHGYGNVNTAHGRKWNFQETGWNSWCQWLFIMLYKNRGRHSERVKITHRKLLTKSSGGLSEEGGAVIMWGGKRAFNQETPRTER